MAEKKEYFEYFLSKLYERQGVDNDLSILKVLKLLFFTTAVDTEVQLGGSNVLIDEVFTKYHAMPYGHVESDIYAHRSNLVHFKVDAHKTEKLNLDYVPSDLDKKKVQAIDNALELLERKNGSIFGESAFTLVELSHQYDSWIINYNKAKSSQSYSHPISAEEIKTEDKFYKLNSFEIF